LKFPETPKNPKKKISVQLKINNWYINSAQSLAPEKSTVGSYQDTVESFEKYLHLSEKYGEKVDDYEVVRKAIEDIRGFLGQASP